MSAEPADRGDSTLSRFDPMLRALVTFGLIEPEAAATNGDGRHWHLVPAVQQRLDSLVAPSPPKDKLIYFGHRCASCGEHGPTRMTEGTFVCDTCRERTTARG